MEAKPARLAVETDPPNAEISIFDKDGKDVTRDREQLPAGKYLIKGSSPGYEPAERSIDLKAPYGEVAIALRPVSPAFELLTGMEGLALTLVWSNLRIGNGGSVRGANGLPDGEHTVVATGPGGARSHRHLPIGGRFATRVGKS